MLVDVLDDDDRRGQVRVGGGDDPAVDGDLLDVPDAADLAALQEAQRKAALALLHSALSQMGYDKATQIMALEGILRELERNRKDGPIRDPERYYFTVFGHPQDKGTWGLSVEGHHLSLNFVVQDGKLQAQKDDIANRQLQLQNLFVSKRVLQHPIGALAIGLVRVR